MTESMMIGIVVFTLATFLGYELIHRVPPTLHTPLMSGANAIHGIILIGAIIVAGQTTEPGLLVVALVAVVLATVNMVGGFVVTDRMLQMFTRKKPKVVKADQNGAGA